MERAAKCKHDELVTSPPVSLLISKAARRATTQAANLHAGRALSNSRLVAVYLRLAIAKPVSHCPGRLKLFDAAKMRGAHTHTHIMAASSSFSRSSVARSGET